MRTPSPTAYGQSLNVLIDDFLNLIHACEYKGVQFEPIDGFTLQDCKGTVVWFLGETGRDAEEIARYLSEGDHE